MREIKQIMINGIDVSKCVCLNSNLMCTQYQLQYGNLHCESNKNCYYKQLKRKEQECEKYKKCINDIKIINKDLFYDLCDNCGWYNTDDCDPYEDYVCESSIKIKQKINEVENK